MADHKNSERVMSGFHITIGAMPRGGVSVAHDLRLLKAALLYADKVTLCSYASTIVKKMDEIESLAPKERMDFVLPFGRAAGMSDEDIGVIVEFERILSLPRRTRRRMPKKMQRELAEAKREYDKTIAQMTSKVKEMAVEAGVEGLQAALESGMVKLHQFSSIDDSDTMSQEYFEVVAEAATGTGTYPLFDDLTGNLVRCGINEQKVTMSAGALSRAKHVGLAADLLRRLPVFDNAKVGEVLAIRKALDRPLVRFRSGIIEFSESVNTAPWDDDFAQDAENVFRGNVEPAILEIEDTIKQDKFLQEMASNFLEKPLAIPSTSGLGILIASVSDFPEGWAAGLGIAAGVALMAWDAARKKRKAANVIEGKQMYFYYRAGEQLRRLV